MACPKCKCKETYQYDSGDDAMPGSDYLERCAYCGYIFDSELEASESFEDDDYIDNQ